MYSNPLTRYARYIILIIILCGGVWLLTARSSPAQETLSRRQAIQAMAPGGPASGDSAETRTLDTPSGTVVHAPVTPTPRDFADVVIDTEQPDSMYNQWLRGEIDLTEDDGLVSALERTRLQEEAMEMGPTPGVQIAQNGPGLQAPTPGIAFDSLDYTDGGGSVPPDPELAVGPNHIIAVVNVAVEMYDKTGATVLGPRAAGSLFTISPCTGGLYDPNVLYDEEADRWFLAYDQGAQSASGGYCVLASQTPDPTGLWNQYFFPFNNATAWLDYPHAGVGDNFIFMGGNYFAVPPSSGFIESRIHAFDKSDLYAGNPVTAITLGLGSGIDTPQPLNLHGQSTATWPAFGNLHYFLGEPFDGANYTLLSWDTSTLTNLGNINLGAGGFPVNSVQNGTGDIQANDWRPQDFEYRNGYGWTAMTISCNPGGGTVNCVRWAQIDLAGGLGPAGSGTLSSNGEYRFFPDLAVNHCDDMAMGYTKSSSSTFPSIWVTGRESGDAVGTLQAEVQLKAGEIAYTAFDGSPHRWGDYTGMTIDPDGLTFWYLGEYSKNTGTTNGRWGNYIGSYTFPDCTLAADYTLEVTPTSISVCEPADAVYTVNLTGLNGWTDLVTLSATSNPGSATFVPPSLVPDGSSTLTVSGATAGSYSFDVVGTGGAVPPKTATIQLDVVAGVPAVVTLAAPPDGTTGVSTTPTLTWNPVADATGYDIEIATDVGFTSIVDSATGVTGTSYAPAGLSADTVYYWRVRANNGCGSGDWSNVWAFRTDAPPTCTDIILDGDFEAGGPGSGWSESSSNGFGIISTNFPDTGSWSAWLGGAANETSQIWQSVTIPATATSANLDWRYWLNSGDVCGSFFDTFELRVGGSAIQTIDACSASDTGGYVSAATVDLLSEAGSTVELRWFLDTDGSLNSSYFVDNVSLEVCSGVDVDDRDYSDLDATYGVAWHDGDGTLRIGSNWDADASFANAADDGTDDGITVVPMKVGVASDVVVEVTGTPATGVWLQAWFDWNNDGDFNDSGEFVHNAVGGLGSNTFSVTPPAGSNAFTETPYRVRLFDALSGPAGVATRGPINGAVGGEVTDGRTDGPTSIELAFFDAQVEADGTVTLVWETAAEIDNAGFNVYRTSSDQFVDSVRVNSALIAAMGIQGQGMAYSLNDADVETGIWYYWLEDVDFYGLRTQHGPVAADTFVPTSVSASGFAGSGGSSVGIALAALLAVLVLGLFGRKLLFRLNR